MLTDGDWSGDTTTCKRTSIGTVPIGKHLVESWSLNQKCIALSTAESEFYAIGSGAARGLTVKSVMKEITESIHKTPAKDVTLELLTDSNAARGMCHRAGVGKVRHLQIRYLWVQQSLKEQLFTLGRIDTKTNASDLGTKPLGEEEVKKHMCRLGLRRC